MIEIVSYPCKPLAAKLAAIFARRAGVEPEVEKAVRDILRQVREGGDVALCALTWEFDKVDAQPGRLRMSAEALAEGGVVIDPGDATRASDVVQQLKGLASKTCDPT